VIWFAVEQKAKSKQIVWFTARFLLFSWFTIQP
jgi:hypothetical protein